MANDELMKIYPSLDIEVITLENEKLNDEIYQQIRLLEKQGASYE